METAAVEEDGAQEGCRKSIRAEIVLLKTVLLKTVVLPRRMRP